MVSQYIYVKRSLCGAFAGIKDVPEAFLMDWLKDTFDFQRSHSDEELLTGMTLEPEGILQWLEEAAQLTWEVKRALRYRPSAARVLCVSGPQEADLDHDHDS